MTFKNYPQGPIVVNESFPQGGYLLVTCQKSCE